MSALIEKGLISDKSSKLEVTNAAKDYIASGVLDSLQLVFTASTQLMSALKCSVTNNQYEAAVIPAGITSEQMINEFYLPVLLDTHGFTKTEYDSCMKALSTKDKLTWLYRIATSENIDNETISQIDKLRKERNTVAHYKPRIEKA